MGISPPDWKAHWVDFDENGDEFDPVPIMIEWLSKQKPTAWHKFVTDYMNWDHSVEIGLWIANQPQCDMATAARLFFDSDPDPISELDMFFNGGTKEISNAILLTVLSNWEQGFYRNSAIRECDIDVDGLTADYEMRLARFRGRTPPFVIPKEFLATFGGEIATFPETESPRVNPQMWALICGLGVEVPTMATAQWRADREAAERLWKSEREGASWWMRQLWYPPRIIPFGPEFEAEEERTRYLQGDPAMSKLLFKRAKRACRKAARG
jgi:Domain of unknown function (DUF4274)